MGVSNYSMLCCALLYFHSSFAIILMGKTELVAFFAFIFAFLVPCDCCVALPYGATGLSAVVIVVFPDQTHLLFFS